MYKFKRLKIKRKQKKNKISTTQMLKTKMKIKGAKKVSFLNYIRDLNKNQIQDLKPKGRDLIILCRI